MSYSPSILSSLVDQKDFVKVEQGITDFILMSQDKNNYIKLSIPAGLHSDDKNAYPNECIRITGDYANVIVKLFCTPGYIASDEILTLFTRSKETLDLVFSLSMWRTTDAIIEKLDLLPVAKLSKYQLTSKKERQLKTLLALFCVGSKHRLPWQNLFKHFPGLALAAYIPIVTQSVSILDDNRCKGFNDSLAAAEKFPLLELRNESQTMALLRPYFYCSYTSGSKKYEFKKWIARLLEYNIPKFLSPHTVAQMTHNHEVDEVSNKTILVPLEFYGKTHAMYRCYNARFVELAKQYKLVALIDESLASNCDFSAFDEVLFYKQSDSIDKLVNTALSAFADMVLYPSIGMSAKICQLAFLRLAPVQAMLGGHPSSSYSSVIDYFIMPSTNYSKEEIQPFINEKVIISDTSKELSKAATRHDSLTDEFISEHKQFVEDEEHIRIGINGVTHKLTSELVSVCKKIQDRASKPVTFVFYSLFDAFHLAGLSTKAQLGRYLKSVEIHSYSDYPTYLKTVSSCHLLLPTFPFGGANSNIDAMLLCRPKLYLIGKAELYTRTDEIEWKQASLEKYLACENFDELFNKAMDIVESVELRREIHQLMEERCKPINLFYDATDKTENDGSPINHHIELIREDFSHQISLLKKQEDKSQKLAG